MEPATAAAAMASAEEQVTRRVASRIIRALQHQLRLLHRAGAEFYVLGATGNVYTVTLATAPACTCPDPSVPCKHILFVLLRVLGLSLDEACVWRQSLRPCQVARLVSTPTASSAAGGEILAGTRAREMFHRLWSARAATKADEEGRRRREESATEGRIEGGAACPVCLEEMSAAVVMSCGTCRNAVHAECFARWKRSRGRRAATCVVCRARWRQPASRDKEGERQYINLSAFMNGGDGGGDVEMGADDGGVCGAG
uniref:SWIM-type domain-containing protein n=1 Tax=Leersia perrieri TaxID=77586 RepID=A0A0D9WR55_9ORYZ